jgi:hypothetical protein
MPKIVTWTTSPHLRDGNTDESLSKCRNTLRINLLAYCHYQHISARARQMINTLTGYHEIDDVFDQRGSSWTDDQHTHGLTRVSEARAPQRINTLTFCQGISDVFGQRGSSSTEDQHTHQLSRDQRRVRSAKLELHRGSTHSHPIKGSATCSVSEARAPQRINTLTPYQGISDVFGQRGSSSTGDQHTHQLSRDQRRGRSARLKLHRGSTHSHPIKGLATYSAARLELHRGLTHLPPVNRSAMP